MDIEEYIQRYPRSYSAHQTHRGIQLKMNMVPSEGPAGTMITLSGNGAKPNSQLGVFWGEVYAQLDLTHAADAQGEFAFQIQIPRVVAALPHAVKVQDEAGSFDEKVFVVTRSIDPALQAANPSAARKQENQPQPRWWQFWKK